LLDVALHNYERQYRSQLCNATSDRRARSFVRSLHAGVQPTLDPSAETIAVQCACPGRGRELVGVCGVSDVYRENEGFSKSEQLVGYFDSAPLLDVAYCLD